MGPSRSFHFYRTIHRSGGGPGGHRHYQLGGAPPGAAPGGQMVSATAIGIRRGVSAWAMEQTTPRKAWASSPPLWFPAAPLRTYQVPYWVILCCHLAIAGGTMAGGWRVVKTMGQKITKLNPFGGFAAETSRRYHPDRDGRRGHPGKHHPRNYRSHRRSGGGASYYCGPMGRYAANFLGLGADHSRRWGDGRGVLLPFVALD